MRTHSVQLGPFSIDDVIGEGGMGAVYGAEHRETGVPVAVKVIRRHADDTVRRRFHREVQAHAGLRHPGVVYLFEYGDIDDRAARASGGDLRAGEPYVAMELADRGTVRDAMPVAGWKTVCRMLVQILDALAYSHARGVIHRDLKPENFLLFDTDDASDWRIKLADFGIAHAFDQEHDTDTDELESAVGTPHYMAPEQLRGQWREYGPWTDLYALGCIAWELVCGRAPFTGDSAFEIGLSHEEDPRPPLDPQFPVPDELASWIHRAMAPETDRRFRRAADAVWALPRAALAERLDASGDRSTSASQFDAETVVEQSAPTRTVQLATTVMLDENGEDGSPSDSEADRDESTRTPTEAARESDESAAADVETDLEELLELAHPPVPEDWRREQLESPPAPLVGAGLGLFDLREPPFVDREAERDQLWEALRRVERAGEPRVVFVVGESGSGKSRLVEWIAARAAEVGAARVMRAVHGRSGESPGEGIGGMIRRLVRGQKLDRGELYDKLLETLPALDEEGDEREMDARAICELVAPTDDDQETVDGPRFRFASPSHRCAVVARCLRRCGGDRPSLVWLDDAQWSQLAMELVEHLVESPFDQPPALVVVTLRSEALVDDSRLRRRVESLAERGDCSDIRLEPLGIDDHRRFVDRMLPLDEALVDRIAERTEGNPLFARQLLGHLVAKGQLDVGPEGFQLAEGAELEVPGEIHELWMRRLARLVARCEDDPDRVWAALERAAALGREVGDAEWRALCDQIDLARPDIVRGSLVARGLAERTDGGWSFSHDLLVDALRRRSRQRGTWAVHNRRCAALLEEVHPEHPKQTAGRRAHHLMEGDKPEWALEPLLAECERLRELGSRQDERETLERRAALLEKLGVTANDPRAIENEIDLARAEVFLGAEPEEGLARIEEARDRADRIGEDRLVSLAEAASSALHQRSGDLPAARETARRATERARGCGDAKALVSALSWWAWAERISGDHASAEKRIREALECAAEHDDVFERLSAQRSLGSIWMSRGRDGRAADCLRETLEETRRAGYRSLEARCHSDLGEIARFGGRADEARSHYRAYARILREVGAPRAVALSYVNLAQVEVMAGRFEEAREQLDEGVRQLEELSLRTSHVHGLRLIELTLSAGRGAWSEFDARLEPYADGWPEDARLVRDHPWLLEMAGDYASDAGERGRAEQVWRLSRRLWEQLGDEEAGARVDAKLDDAY